MISNGMDLDLANCIATSPKKVVLYEPAIQTCYDNNSFTEACNNYYISNVMLGHEILINSCIMDYFDYITSSEYMLISFRAPMVNFTLNFSSFKLGVEDRVLINVTIILSSCHPGFQYNPQTQKCECHHHNVVFCSGNSSMIQKDYWFGEVAGLMKWRENNACS